MLRYLHMPTFDFRCQNCNQVFEFSRPFGSKEVPVCPKCKSKKTEKLMSSPAIVFKGSGWYKTDSRPAPKKDAVKKAEKKEPLEKSTEGTEGTKVTEDGKKTAGPKSEKKTP